MLIYSALLTVALVVSAPWWLLRMVTMQRYREGLRQRLGGVPASLGRFVAGKRVVWVHAVSVGEVLAASRMVLELEAASEDRFCVVVSTTTRTGQALAQQRFGAHRVFYMPLDFAYSVRAYLRVLKPVMVVLMESELWPRLLQECRRREVPVIVVNARMSDRSFARAMRVQPVWGRVMRKPTLWLAQSEEDALRLVIAGVRRERVRVSGNLKYDVQSQIDNAMAGRIGSLVGDAKIVIAGSTLEGEEEQVLRIWPGIQATCPDAVLLIAPRHPERFESVAIRIEQSGYTCLRCSVISDRAVGDNKRILLLDTIGDLAAVYGLGAVAFVGGSLVRRGGHNPLEPARFGVSVVIGPSFENFRDIVAKMRESDGIRVVGGQEELKEAILTLLTHGEEARGLGERGRNIFEEQQGATSRTVKALIAILGERSYEGA